MPEAIREICMKLTVCDSCSKDDVKNGEYCDCDDADFVSGWLQSFEYRKDSPEGRLPDDVDVDAEEYGTLTVKMPNGVYDYAMKRSFWRSHFPQILRESKRGGISAGSYWNYVEDGSDTKDDSYDEMTVIELE